MLRTSLRTDGHAVLGPPLAFLSSNAQDFIEENRETLNAHAQSNS